MTTLTQVKTHTPTRPAPSFRGKVWTFILVSLTFGWLMAGSYFAGLMGWR